MEVLLFQNRPRLPKLTKDAVNVLAHFATFPPGALLNETQIAGALGIGTQRALLRLEQLAKLGLLHDRLTAGEPIRFSLTGPGREYLARKQIL